MSALCLTANISLEYAQRLTWGEIIALIDEFSRMNAKQKRTKASASDIYSTFVKDGHE